MQLVGKVERVVYADGRFVVLAVSTGAGRRGVSVSGKVTSICPQMPVQMEVTPRRGRADRQYGEEYEIVSFSEPDPAWMRSAGVWAWLSSGGAGLEIGAEILVREFQASLPKVIVHDPQRVAEALQATYGDFAVDAAASLQHLAPVVEAAADLGAKGLGWAVSRLTTRYGSYAPLLLGQDVRGLLGSGVISAGALVQAEVLSSLGELVAGVCTWECKLLGTDRISARQLIRLVSSAVGDDAERGLKEAVGSGAVLLVGQHVVPSEVAIGASAFLEALSLVQAGALPPETTLRPGVSCVVAPPGADLSWLTKDLQAFRSDDLTCKVVYPDQRGSLSHLVGLPDGAQDSVDGADVDVLVVMDSHRFTYAKAARLVHDHQSVRALIFVGDEALWCPGSGERLVADLASLERFPVVRLVGQGAAYMARNPDVELGRLPGVIRGDPSPAALRLWQRVVPSTAAAKVGRQVVLVEPTGGVEAGAVGRVVSVESRSVAHVDFGDCGVQQLRMWRTASGVPTGWLPGVQTSELWLTDAARRELWIAALAATDTLYVTETAVSQVRANLYGLERESLLAQLRNLAQTESGGGQ